MTILIIGGAGYIGAHVAREFLDAGHTVTVYDNLSSGLVQNIFADEEFIEGDIMDFIGLIDVMRRGFDAVVHLAAFKAAGESMLWPGKYAVNNITGTINILNATVESGIKYLIFSSSAAVYGDPKYLPIDEKHPTNPVNFYGFTKLEIERFFEWYDRLKGLRCASLRYFNAAGYDLNQRVTGLERNPANLLPVVMEAACGMREEVSVFGCDYDTPDGSGVRDYVHVTDLARGHTAALDTLVKTGKSFTVNLGGENGISVLEMIETARLVSGKEIRYRVTERRPGDPAKLTASSEKARELMGWKAQYSDVETLVSSSWKVYSLAKANAG
ncbi:MAG: UDP-glucose 4-epimerase GalE [Spirochaetaceae bacterium]|jgi:UDP-glucose 4-epimerase|nr:UDP-glucose 4-epimerase GalE [Spirochaetaceae bacterium]